jgi:hypothetical protein
MTHFVAGFCKWRAQYSVRPLDNVILCLVVQFYVTCCVTLAIEKITVRHRLWMILLIVDMFR